MIFFDFHYPIQLYSNEFKSCVPSARPLLVWYCVCRVLNSLRHYYPIQIFLSYLRSVLRSRWCQLLVQNIVIAGKIEEKLPGSSLTSKKNVAWDSFIILVGGGVFPTRILIVLCTSHFRSGLRPNRSSGDIVGHPQGVSVIDLFMGLS